MKISGSVLNDNGLIDPHKIDLIGRLGEDYYIRASGDAVFSVKKPLVNKGIGVDAIPQPIRNSTILSGNDLGKLGNVEHLPSMEEIQDFLQKNEAEIKQMDEMELHKFAGLLLLKNEVNQAWLYLLSFYSL